MILVTGPSGNVGAAVVERLQAAGRPVRAAVRDPGRAPFGPGVEVVRLEFGAPETYGPAFAGVTELFLMRPPQLTDVRGKLLPALARAPELRRVVFLSLQGAERNPLVPHRTVERYLERSGLGATFLRPSFFMQNLSGVHRPDLARGLVYVPAGRGKTSFVDARDVGEVAAKVLLEGTHDGRAYELTGAEALTYDEVAAVFSAVLGRPVRYPNPSPLSFWRRMRARGLPPGYVTVMLALYSACRFGLAARVTGDTARLLGRAPRRLADFADDYRELWALSP